MAPQASDRVRQDSSFDWTEVPATVVCAACGDPDCAGCTAFEHKTASGVVAIIPWERRGVGLFRKLWQTSTLATSHARTFFGVLPDGDAGTALAFALLAETLAVTGLALGLMALALIALPSLPSLLVQDPVLRRTVLRGVLAGTILLMLGMVSLHAAHGVALDIAARRAGSQGPQRGLRFGLYACGWDLITLPFGLLLTALINGIGAARRAVPLGLTAPMQAAEAYLTGMHGLSVESARKAARQAAYFTGVPAVFALLVGGLLFALAVH
jgi:hypothetical protein